MRGLRILLLGMMTMATMAAADPREYIVPPNQGAGLSISMTSCEPRGPSVGAVRFCAGHISPDVNGAASISIEDDLNAPVSGVYCQDLDGDQLCGEGQFPPDGTRIEPRHEFCGSMVLDSPMDPTPRADWAVHNWDPFGFNADVLIFIDGIADGNPATSRCGFVFSYGTHGWVWHS
jgi:hypothetical protein